ncbi:MAG: hypothetical protein KatS3mg057_0693 [Herpetosiphonaceae bacterium]|nr:MAG: hypothetical protein KatS3mg057_0693 [Herpetosiphonaceae bacterium]
MLKVDVPSYSERSTKPYVILVAGVNGVGKTTLIAKLAHRYKTQMNKRVILGRSRYLPRRRYRAAPALGGPGRRSGDRTSPRI